MSGSIFLWALWVSSPLPAHPTSGLATLMKHLREVRGFEARFVETKQLGLLEAPLVSEGRLYFQAPDRLARVVESPSPSRTVVAPRELVMIRGHQAERLELGSRPEVRSLVTSMLSLLRGDIATLKSFYEVTYRATKKEDWTLELRPRSPELGALVRELVFEGHRTSLRRFIVRETSGDTARTEITDVRRRAQFSAKEQAALFATPKTQNAAR